MGHLPNMLRPRGLPHRDFHSGSDLPDWFHRDIKSLDPKLYFVWHPWRVLYDDVMNQWTGELENPRFSITEYSGQEVWGFPMTDNNGAPIPENRWHIWRLCWPHGWCHVCNVASDQEDHLKTLLKRLDLQAQISNMPNSQRTMLRMRQLEEEELMVKKQKEATDLCDDTHQENAWLLRKAMDNLSSNVTASTNPQKETITSYAGQVNKSRIIRPLDDEEGGIVTPEGY